MFHAHTDKPDIVHQVICNAASSGRGFCGKVALADMLRFLVEQGGDALTTKAFDLVVEKLEPSVSENVDALKYVMDHCGSSVVNEFDDTTGLNPLLRAATNQRWGFVSALLHESTNLDVFVREPVQPEAIEQPEATPSNNNDSDEGNADDEDADGDKEPTLLPRNPYAGWSLLHLLVAFNQPNLFFKCLELAKANNVELDLGVCNETPDGSPLIFAAASDLTVCKFLVSHPSVDVNATDNNGKSLLHVFFAGTAIGGECNETENSMGHHKRQVGAHQVQAGGFGFSGSNNSGRYSHYHYNRADVDTLGIQSLINLKRWCKEAGKKLEWDIVDSSGAMPIHRCAAAAQGTSCLRLLLEEVPDAINVCDKRGNSPLAFALLNQNLHVATYLLEKGAKLTNPVVVVEPNNNNNNNNLTDSQEEAKEIVTTYSVYQYALTKNFVGVIFAILQHPECDLEEMLSASIAGENTAWTKQLMLQVNVVDPTFAGRLLMLLFKCCKSPNDDTFKSVLKLAEELLQNLPADTALPSVSDERTGDTLLHHFVINDHPSDGFAGLLQVCGEDSLSQMVSRKNNAGKTPLHLAVSKHAADLVATLLGAMPSAAQTVNEPDLDGNTALHLALLANDEGVTVNTEILRVLVSYGGDLTLENNEGQTCARALGSLPDADGDKLLAALSQQVAAGDQAVQVALAKGRQERDEKASKSATKRAAARIKYKALAKQMQSRGKTLEKARAQASLMEETMQTQLAKEQRLVIPLYSHHMFQREMGSYQVHCDPETGGVYSAMLRKTDLRAGMYGSNQFCSLQLVELPNSQTHANIVAENRRNHSRQHGHQPRTFRSGGGISMYTTAHYRVFERWGRSGDENRAMARNRGFQNLDAAKAYFKKQFEVKTKMEFDGYVVDPNTNHYLWVTQLYEEKPPSLSKKERAARKAELAKAMPEETSLLLRVISDLRSVRRELSSEGLHTDTQPLGELISRTMIVRAYEILDRISGLLASQQKLSLLRGKLLKQQGSEVTALRQRIEQLSNRLYKVIPRDFGSVSQGNLRRMSSITSAEAVAKEVQLLRSFEDVEDTLTLVLGGCTRDAPLVRQLEALQGNLGANIRPIAKDSDKFRLLQQYVHASASHNDIVAALRVTRYEDAERFAPFEACRGVNNKQGLPCNRLLFHSTRVSNCVGILSQGFRIAPPEAPMNGQAYGKGVYFADAFSKSAGYAASRNDMSYHGNTSSRSVTSQDLSDENLVGSLRVMFVCEVALGEAYQYCDEGEAMRSTELPPAGFDSVFVRGSMTPDPAGNFITTKGVGIPLGRLKTDPKGKGGLSEYIVYDERRVKIKYVLLFK